MRRRASHGRAVRSPVVTGVSEAGLRRTWPQRLVIAGAVAVIVSAVVSAQTVKFVEETFEEVQRVAIIDTGQYGGQLLVPETEPGEPVNFLIVGTDSALGLDPSDPAASGREVDPGGRSLADTIMLARLDPKAGSARVLSIPRDLWVEIPGAQDNKIASAFFIGGATLLVATITSMFDVEINHYVQMDFAAFQRVVDTLGGVPVWFPNPVRDSKSGLDVAEPGCHVLDGSTALQYVRSRTYTEFVDGRWRITQGDDFGRIERQQDFLVLALDRAIRRGARNPSTMVNLLEAGAASVTLDQDLTAFDLITLGKAFADFNPENLHRERVDVYTLLWPDGSYKGEAARKDANQALLDVFRGEGDPIGLSASPPTGAGVGEGTAIGPGSAMALPGQGFGGPTLAAASLGSLGTVSEALTDVLGVAARFQDGNESPTILGRPPEGQTCG